MAKRKEKRVLSDEALELIARRFGVLSEPMRLRLLHHLLDGEKNVTALVAATGAGQANISRHLQNLAQAGFVQRRREGLQVYYSIADEEVFRLCDIVCGSLEKQLSAQSSVFPR